MTKQKHDISSDSNTDPDKLRWEEVEEEAEAAEEEKIR
jgi:hypothetical protein